MRKPLLAAFCALVAWQHARAVSAEPPVEEPYRELARLNGLEVPALAQDATYLYLSERGDHGDTATISKIPKAGGPKVAIYTGPDVPGAMVVTPSGIYYTRASLDGGIMFLPTGGRASKRLDKATGDAAVTLKTKGVTPVQEFQLAAPYDNLVVDGNQIFVSSTLAKVVGVMPKAGGRITVIGAPDGGVTGLTTQGKDVFYTTSDGRLCRVGKNGKGGITDVLTGRTEPHDVVALGGGVAWADGKLVGPGSLFHLPRGARAPVPLAFPPDSGRLSNLAVGGDVLWYVYADKWGSTRLATVPVAGGKAAARPGPFGIDAVVADAHAVYFVGIGKDGKYKYVGSVKR